MTLFEAPCTCDSPLRTITVSPCAQHGTRGRQEIDNLQAQLDRALGLLQEVSHLLNYTPVRAREQELRDVIDQFLAAHEPADV